MTGDIFIQAVEPINMVIYASFPQLLCLNIMRDDRINSGLNIVNKNQLTEIKSNALVSSFFELFKVGFGTALGKFGWNMSGRAPE